MEFDQAECDVARPFVFILLPNSSCDWLEMYNTKIKLCNATCTHVQFKIIHFFAIFVVENLFSTIESKC